jgi:RNA polymerase sigma-70 factor (ECF subfamily)
VVLRRLAQFKGRGSLKNWLSGILVNRAKPRDRRDARVIPGASVGDGQGEAREHPPAAGRSGPSNKAPSQRSAANSDGRQSGVEGELLNFIVREVVMLPVSERAVIYLRDIRGLGATEVCELLSISDSAQRVHLHRARERVRSALAEYGSFSVRRELGRGDRGLGARRGKTPEPPPTV